MILDNVSYLHRLPVDGGSAIGLAQGVLVLRQVVPDLSGKRERIRTFNTVRSNVVCVVVVIQNCISLFKARRSPDAQHVCVSLPRSGRAASRTPVRPRARYEQSVFPGNFSRGP